MDTLTNLGTMQCEMCGDTTECFDVGSAGSPEPRCARCYADGVGHGGGYGCPVSCEDAFEAAIGRECNDNEKSLISAYYPVGCGAGDDWRDCPHY